MYPRTRCCLAILVTMATLAQGTLARAAEPDERLRARELFNEAEASFAVGDFEAAVRSYQAAYRLAPLAGFLYNLGQCHRNLGKHEKAAFLFRSYLVKKPDAKNRPIVEELIAEMDAKVAAAKAGREPAAQRQPSPEPRPAEPPSDQAPLAAMAAAEIQVVESPDPAPSLSLSRMDATWEKLGALGSVGAVVAVVGFASLVGGSTVGWRARASAERAQRDPVAVSAAAEHASARSQARLANVLLATGALLTLGGGVSVVVQLEPWSAQEASTPASGAAVAVGLAW